MKTFVNKLTFLLLLSTSFIYAQEDEKKLTLEDIFQSREYYPQRIANITSLNDGERYLQTINDSINIFSYRTGKFLENLVCAQDLIPEGDSIPISLQTYKLNKSETKILFFVDMKRIYRHSYKSKNYVYDLEKKELQLLANGEKQQLASFSPDGNKVAYVRNNNLYYYDLSSRQEIEITNDGSYNNIIYGTTDWVYEEEFSFTRAFYWSPDGSSIAYYRFDEREVKEFEMTTWGKLYPENYKYKYPKAGEDNSKVDIFIFNITDKQSIKVDLGEASDIYIPRIKWTNNPNLLSIQWLNRLQNDFKILLANAKTGKTNIIYQEQDEYYVEITDDLTFLEAGNQFIISSEKDGFNHLYLYGLDGTKIKQITLGNWDVNEFLGIDESKGVIYYISSETAPINRELYSINIDGTEKTQLSERIGNNRVKFSKQFQYYENTYSNASTPPIITINNPKGKIIRVLEDNQDLINKTQDLKFSTKEFLKIITTQGNTLNAWMIKPQDFDENKKYPVLMYVYGGPGSQTVLNTYGDGSLWYQLLAEKGAIIVSVDNRGTGSRGAKFKKMTYQQLGNLETEDQIEMAKYLSNLKYVDSKRIGIWGWSYGGYMSSLCITRGADYFSMAMAVAPVTNWRYYDNIYTERYMRTPQENPKGYDDNSPINHVDKLKGKYLIVHGTEDDNVHMQNSIDMITSLVNSNKQFEMQLYPNSNHGIYTGKNTRIHLYTRLTNFVIDNLILSD
jgi:dipeptidyl-peptidase-4